MVKSQRRRNLSSTRQTRSDAMTVSTRQLLRRIVTGVTEPNSIRGRLLRGANEASKLMTSAARRDVAPVRRSIRRVTTKTSDMRAHSRWNRETNSTAVASVTSVARSTCRRVSRVIEFNVETPQLRKRFDLSTLRVRMANRTDLTRRICELLCVTTCAWRM